MGVDVVLTAAGRRLRARMAAHVSWSRTTNPSDRTAPARAKFLERFEDLVDKDRLLPASERERMAESARKAYYVKLAYASSKARSGRREAKETTPATVAGVSKEPVELPADEAA